MTMGIVARKTSRIDPAPSIWDATAVVCVTTTSPLLLNTPHPVFQSNIASRKHVWPRNHSFLGHTSTVQLD